MNLPPAILESTLRPRIHRNIADHHSQRIAHAVICLGGPADAYVFPGAPKYTRFVELAHKIWGYRQAARGACFRRDISASVAWTLIATSGMLSASQAPEESLLARTIPKPGWTNNLSIRDIVYQKCVPNTTQDNTPQRRESLAFSGN